MAIYKRGGKFWYMIYRPDGPLLRCSTGTGDEAVARAVEKTMTMAVKKQTDAGRLHAMIDALLGTPVVEGLPLDAVWGEYERFLRAKNTRLAKPTMDGRRHAAARFAKWSAKYYPAATCAEQVDRGCALAFAEWLAKKGTAGKTRKNVIGDLQAVWKGLRTIRDGVGDPWPLVMPDTSDSGRGSAFTREHEAAVIAAADAAGHGWGLACRIARHTGLRYGDVATLKWGCVEAEAGWIALEPSKTARHGVSVRVPMSSGLRAALAQARPPEASAGDYVLPDLGAVYPLRFKACTFQDVLRAAGLEEAGYTFQSWRHTFRTRLSAAGVSDEIAKRLGGWREDATAMRYDHDGRAAEMRAAVEAAGES